MCAECVGKDNMAYGIQCLVCSSALGTPSRLVRIFQWPFPAPFPFHLLICLSLDANTGQKLKLKRSLLPTQGHHHKPDTQGTENEKRNLIGRGGGQ